MNQEKKKKQGLLSRLQYRFDKLMARGSLMLILLLLAVTLVFVILVSLLGFFFFRGQMEGGLLKIIWESFMRTLDPGNLAGDYDSQNAGYILVMLLSTLYGLFMLSALIGIVSDMLNSKLEQLRRGSSQVMEKQHTLILGFDEHVYTIISELVEANRNVKRSCVVVLSPLDRLHMEESIRFRVPDLGKTQVICRTGDVTSFADLKKAGIKSCKSVIILPRDEDAITIKTLLACNVLLRDLDSKAYITASIYKQENLKAAMSAGESNCEVLYFGKTMARIIAQVAYQPGFSAVLSELLSFHGMEFYLEELAGATGKTYGEVALLMEDACLIGVASGGQTLVNPPPETRFQEGDAVIVLAEDDGAAHLRERLAAIREDRFPPVHCVLKEKRDRILILGSNHLLDDTLEELSAYLLPGSEIVIAARASLGDREGHGGVKISAVQCNPLCRDDLAQLMDRPYDAIIALSDMSKGPEAADADSLIIMLHLSELLRDASPRPTVVSEIRDPINQELAECTHVNDLVIGSNLVSLLMTQISERREMHDVFTELLNETDCEVYIKTALRYAHPGQALSALELTASALRYNESFIGYIKTDEAGKQQIVFNPDKEERILLGERDALIVVAEDFN